MFSRKCVFFLTNVPRELYFNDDLESQELGVRDWAPLYVYCMPYLGFERNANFARFVLARFCSFVVARFYEIPRGSLIIGGGGRNRRKLGPSLKLTPPLTIATRRVLMTK